MRVMAGYSWKEACDYASDRRRSWIINPSAREFRYGQVRIIWLDPDASNIAAAERLAGVEVAQAGGVILGPRKVSAETALRLAAISRL